MSRIEKLEKFKGMPIPFIVYRDNENFPHFKVNDDKKVDHCIISRKCSVCGEKMKSDMWLIGGPMSAFHPRGAYIDIPVHKECGVFALKNCPYMAYTKYESKIPLGKLDLKIDSLELFNPTQTSERLKYFVFIKIADYIVVAKGHQRFVYPKKPYVEVEYWRDGIQLTKEKAEAYV